MRKFACGTPDKSCSGGNVQLSSGIAGKMRAHSTPTEAFKCYARHLIQDLGYTPIGPREFSPPDGGPVRVLTKKSRFGGELRPGKAGKGGSVSRFMPSKRPGGIIIG